MINLKNIRVENNITVEELAKQLGVSRQTVYNWEYGIKKPSKKNLKKMADIFNVKEEAIITPPADKNTLEYIQALNIINQANEKQLKLITKLGYAVLTSD